MRITKPLVGTAMGAAALGATLAFGLGTAGAATHSAGKTAATSASKTAATTSSVSAAKSPSSSSSTRHKCP